MKTARIGRLNKRFVVACIFVATALFLMAGALMEPKQKETGQWVPLNEAVGDAIAKMEQPIEPSVSQEPANEGSLTTPSKNDERDNDPLTVNQTEEKAVDTEQHAPSEDGVNEGRSAVTAGREEAAADGKLDINRATVSELDELKGIGPAKAQAIIDDRNNNGKFASVEDLQRVKGIGEKLLQGIKDSIVARP
ncbi:ComEA family DNA-binding protein [Paenibacillus luteus]|uniref:ComEA family DNA-binding protein n=1 Tax=Paenibacillus luteus TaxID=2545753 RepID=UPI001143F708|nr:ComEA family DNA-binding protein [Paenibacillus luteus]